MKALFLAVSCIVSLSLPLFAQNAPRVVRPPVQQPSGAQQAPEVAEALGKNITIRLHGTTTTGADIDLSLCGVGPRFTADQVVNEDTTLICTYLVSETDTGYRVTYTISARIKVAIQSGGNTSHEFRDISTSGTVLCVADRPQVLVRNGSKPLHLTITREEEKP